MVLQWLILVATLQGSVSGMDNGLLYGREDLRPCTSDNQCIQNLGEICWWFYDGCTHGQCMCDPRTHFLEESSGQCKKIKFGGETCQAGDHCPKRMVCRDGFCACPEGMRMTSDARFCLKSRERLLGESCNAVTDTCFLNMATGYHIYKVECQHQQCMCRSGYTQDAGKCRKLYTFEGPCGRDHQCQGGALCRGNYCMCPGGYFAASGGSTCVKNGAQYDLGLGAHCDEINQSKYCGKDLVCKQCPKETHYTCIAYRESESYNSALVASGMKHSASLSSTVFTSLLSLLLLQLLR